MPASKAYKSIVTASFEKRRIDGRECWAVVQRLTLNDSERFGKGTRVQFGVNCTSMRGKVSGFGAKWEEGFICLFVKGKEGTLNFDLIVPMLYTNFGTSITSLIHRYASLPVLRSGELRVSNKGKDIQRDVENKQTTPSAQKWLAAEEAEDLGMDKMSVILVE
jgi:hypothetical protein